MKISRMLGNRPRWKRGLVLLVVVGLCIVFPALQVSATVMAKLEMRDLVGRATRIAQVVVEKTTSRWTSDGKTIVTDTVVRVEKMIQGKAVDRFTLRRLGGNVDGIAVNVPGSAALSIGTRFVVFAEKRGAYWCMVGMQQGVYRIYRDKRGVDRVGRNLAKIEFIGKSGTQSPDAQPASLVTTQALAIRGTHAKAEAATGGETLKALVSKIQATAVVCRGAADRCAPRKPVSAR